MFYDSGQIHYKILRQIWVPSTQKCLCYVKRKHVLFSAGADGAIFAWNMDKIFSNDFVEDEALREKEKRKFDYTTYIAEKTPWFVGYIINCLVDLPNINFLATGSYDKLIRLWDLRGTANDVVHHYDYVQRTPNLHSQPTRKEDGQFKARRAYSKLVVKVSSARETTCKMILPRNQRRSLRATLKLSERSHTLRDTRF